MGVAADSSGGGVKVEVGNVVEGAQVAVKEARGIKRTSCLLRRLKKRIMMMTFLLFASMVGVSCCAMVDLCSYCLLHPYTGYNIQLLCLSSFGIG